MRQFVQPLLLQNIRNTVTFGLVFNCLHNMAAIHVEPRNSLLPGSQAWTEV